MDSALHAHLIRLLLAGGALGTAEVDRPRVAVAETGDALPGLHREAVRVERRAHEGAGTVRTVGAPPRGRLVALGAVPGVRGDLVAERREHHELLGVGREQEHDQLVGHRLAREERGAARRLPERADDGVLAGGRGDDLLEQGLRHGEEREVRGSDVLP